MITRAAAAALLPLLFSVSAVAAHAELEESDPTDGATIETPYVLTATFSEEFNADTEVSFIRVQDASGAVVATGGQSADDPTTMTVDLPALEPGEYTVRWQTTTKDDNGTERGTFTFNVPPAAPTPNAAPNGSNGGTTGSSNDVFLALIVGLVVVADIAAFLFSRSRRRPA